MPYSEDDLLPISALQHLSFCERQWGLIHLESLWEENRLTVEGRHLHNRTDSPETEVRGDVRIVRGLRLRSLRLGLSGMADVVEFHRLPERGPAKQSEHGMGVSLNGVSGLWQPFPVEYKRGKPKHGPADEMQLCAQALCIEEMMTTVIPNGALFYGTPRRRYDVPFENALRLGTEALCSRLHMLTGAGKTPPAEYGSKCESCSLFDRCMPKLTAKKNRVKNYMASVMENNSDGSEL